MPKLEGRVGIFAGAARGMGKAHALTLAREGADVAVVDIGRDQPVDREGWIGILIE
jgi:NAD(P)-dependent dehydrogenase (short-subunit alcohol dehydrogenase family)